MMQEIILIGWGLAAAATAAIITIPMARARKRRRLLSETPTIEQAAAEPVEKAIERQKQAERMLLNGESFIISEVYLHACSRLAKKLGACGKWIRERKDEKLDENGNPMSWVKIFTLHWHPRP